MAKKKLVSVAGGEIYAIPLFVSEEPELKRFTKKDFSGEGQEFAFMRAISDEQGAGIIIEVFDCVGDLATPLPTILSAQRLFRPIAISGLSLYKKRWPLVGMQEGYDKERDSRYSEIELVLWDRDNPTLWSPKSTLPLAPERVADYEMWTLWGASIVEKRIIAALAERGV